MKILTQGLAPAQSFRLPNQVAAFSVSGAVKLVHSIVKHGSSLVSARRRRSNMALPSP